MHLPSLTRLIIIGGVLVALAALTTVLVRR